MFMFLYAVNLQPRKYLTVCFHLKTAQFLKKNLSLIFVNYKNEQVCIEFIFNIFYVLSRNYLVDSEF